MKFQYTYELDIEVDRQLEVINSSVIELTDYYGLSEYDLAKCCEMSSHAFWRLFQNETHSLRLRTLLKILNYFNIDLIEIIIKAGNTLIKSVVPYSRFEDESQYVERQVKYVNILIKHIVERENITMYRLARNIGIKPEVTRKIELNKNYYAPSLSTVLKILTYSDIDLSESVKHAIDEKMGKKKPKRQKRPYSNNDYAERRGVADDEYCRYEL